MSVISLLFGAAATQHQRLFTDRNIQGSDMKLGCMDIFDNVVDDLVALGYDVKDLSFSLLSHSKLKVALEMAFAITGPDGMLQLSICRSIASLREQPFFVQDGCVSQNDIDFSETLCPLSAQALLNDQNRADIVSRLVETCEYVYKKNVLLSLDPSSRAPLFI